MSTFYVFEGSPDCGPCDGQSGYYTIYPGRPHDNCGCEITEVEDKDCLGEWEASGGPFRDMGDYFEQDMILNVTQPDGSVETDIVTIRWPIGTDYIDSDAFMDAMEEALEDRARELSEDCQPFLCV